MKQCDKTATYIIPWAGKIVKQCEEHTSQILLIAKVTGNICEPELIETEEKCTQEVEESD